MRFSGKKLLMLGTSVASVDIVKYAQENGAYVIVTDYLPTERSAAKQIADETAMVSTIDVEAVYQLAKEKQVDGIFCGVSEPNLVTVQAVCERLGLPCYFNAKQWELCEDKVKFKETCREFGVPVAKEYRLTTEFLPEDLEKIEYPVIVKPVDRSAAIGIHICTNEQELREGFVDALDKSFCGQAIVEELLQGDEVSAAYTAINGEIKLSSIGDKHLNREQIGLTPLPEAYVYPSKHINEYVSQCDAAVVRMMKSIGIQNGTVFVQGIFNGKRFGFFEAGLRMGGTALYRFVSRINGINMAHMLTDYALTGDISAYDINKEDAYFKGNACCILSLLNSGGKIAKICNVEKAAELPDVAETIIRYREGETILRSGTLKQSHIRFFIISNSVESLRRTICEIQNMVEVTNEEGNNMLLTPFDTNKLF